MSKSNPYDSVTYPSDSPEAIEKFNSLPEEDVMGRLGVLIADRLRWIEQQKKRKGLWGAWRQGNWDY